MSAGTILRAMDRHFPNHGLKLIDIEAFLKNQANHRAFEDFKKNPKNIKDMEERGVRTNAAMWAWYIYHVLLIWSASGW